MRLTPAPAVALVAVLLLGGCGGGDGASGSSAAVPTEQQIIDGLSLATDDNGITYKTPDGCEVAVIMTGKQAVSTYRDAGDTVAANDAGTAGLKLVQQPASCTTTLSKKLNDLGS